jgi:hypothetical protein
MTGARPEGSDLLRRAVALNLRLYQGLVDVSLEYLRGLARLFGPAASAAAGSAPEAGVLLLEGEAGAVARSAFLVTNDRDAELPVRLVATPFSDPAGREVRPTLTFDPSEELTLAPRRQQLVTAVVEIGTDLTPGLGYRGAITVDGMEGLTVPVVLRRRYAAAARPEAEGARAAPPAGSRSKERRRGKRQQPQTH